MAESDLITNATVSDLRDVSSREDILVRANNTPIDHAGTFKVRAVHAPIITPCLDGIETSTTRSAQNLSSNALLPQLQIRGNEEHHGEHTFNILRIETANLPQLVHGELSLGCQERSREIKVHLAHGRRRNIEIRRKS